MRSNTRPPGSTLITSGSARVRSFDAARQRRFGPFNPARMRRIYSAISSSESLRSSLRKPTIEAPMAATGASRPLPSARPRSVY
jgi:hypothetical protein